MRISKVDCVNFTNRNQKLVTFKSPAVQEAIKNDYAKMSAQNWQAQTINRISPVSFTGKKEEDVIPVIIFMGPPLVGKGTQAKMVSQKTNYPHISVGAILRKNIEEGTELGKLSESYVKAGKLIPSDVVIDLVIDRIEQEDCKKGFILDGFPRREVEAEALLKHIENKKAQGVILQPKAVNFLAPDDILLQRVAKRALEQKRSDDTPEIAKDRLETYYRETKPVEKILDGINVLTNIDTCPDSYEMSVEEVMDEVVDILDIDED